MPHPTLIRKWSSVLECEPGFIKESFESISKEAQGCPEKKDCCLVIDAMSIRKQILWDANQNKYVGFVSYGEVPAKNPDIFASEAVVCISISRYLSHWKCPVGYFLADKISAKTQAQLVKIALRMSAEAWLRVWSVTSDGTTVNLSMFRELGCKFTTSLC